jgi:hypothetical protein
MVYTIEGLESGYEVIDAKPCDCEVGPHQLLNARETIMSAPISLIATVQAAKNESRPSPHVTETIYLKFIFLSHNAGQKNTR